ncbi:MAG: TIGR01212 family radical SAM protein [Planctomycetota bacterium]
MGMEILTLGRWLRRRFGHRVIKIPLDAGMTCPNIDGTKSTGGCAFCDNRAFSPVTRAAGQSGHRPSIADQLQSGMAGASDTTRFIAYFQAHTNTYSDPDKLDALWRDALAVSDRIIGLAVGTRPDCVSDAVIERLERLADEGWHVWLELGLQSVHDAKHEGLNRCYATDDFDSAIARAAGRGVFLCAHLIFGLPGETRSDMLASVSHLAALPLDGVKFHQLQIIRDTALAERYAREPFPLLEPDEYASLVADAIRILPPSMVIQRFMADAPAESLIAPVWRVSKSEMLEKILTQLAG